MQQRQLRLGDILDDYCPRERRLTNHAVVAMIGDEVKQTRCTTCDAEHEYKHAKVPRQRRRADTPAALYANVAASGPKRVPHEQENGADGQEPSEASEIAEHVTARQPEKSEGAPSETLEVPVAASADEPTPFSDSAASNESDQSDGPRDEDDADVEEGPVHRPLIRATLPRPDGQPPPARPAPDFTIRQPGGRQNRFRNRHQRGGQPFFGNRSNGNTGGGPTRGGMPRQGGGRPPHGPMSSRSTRRQGGGPGRKRSK
jgi:hypothetical protein